jgi:hypothetical protein
MGGMRRITIITMFGMLSLFLTGCCAEERNNPPMPNGSPIGWQHWKIGGTDTIICGNFVLRKGESVNDGNVGITVVELYPARCGLFNHPPDDTPQVKLRFFRVLDQKTLLDFTYYRGTGDIMPEREKE